MNSIAPSFTHFYNSNIRRLEGIPEEYKNVTEVFNRKNPIPETPGSKIPYKRILDVKIEKSPFAHALSSIKKAVSFKNNLISNMAYQTPSGRIYPLISQRGTKNCGGAASLMLALSFLRESELNEEYIHDCDKAYLIGPKEIASSINKICAGLAVGEVYDTRDGCMQEIDLIAFCKFLKNILPDSPVILGIDHKELSGHYIVIDEYDGKFYYVRDPYSCKAYLLSESELCKNIDAGCGINLVYFKKRSSDTGVCMPS